MKALLLRSALLLCAVSAHAASITYGFVGDPPLAGTNFTYISPTGFLGFSATELTPTTATDVFFNGIDQGHIVGFSFDSSTLFHIFYQTPTGILSGAVPDMGGYSLTAFGGQDVVAGSLFILATPPSASVTPEPSSFILLGTGALGIFGAARRRFSQIGTYPLDKPN